MITPEFRVECKLVNYEQLRELWLEKELQVLQAPGVGHDLFCNPALGRLKQAENEPDAKLGYMVNCI